MAPIWTPFVKEKPDELLLLARAAEKFGQWPSELLTQKPFLQRFNLAAAEAIWEAAAEKAEASE
jgi:hypothetical protein